jgi:hypothetical protein
MTDVRSEMGVVPVLPDYGVFLRTPGDGTDWIHPDDVSIITGLIPGDRVFCRWRFEHPYYYFRYGEIHFRLKPCLWLSVKGEGIDIGDRVETIGVGMRQELFVSEVTDMIYSQRTRRIRYRLARTPRSDQFYDSDQLRLLTDKTHLRPADTLYPLPRWNRAAREAYPSSDYLHLGADDEADHRADE